MVLGAVPEHRYGGTTLRAEHRIMLLSALLAVATWVLAAVLAASVDGEARFRDQLLLNVPASEVLGRLLTVVAIMALGAVVTMAVRSGEREQRSLHLNAVLRAAHEVKRRMTTVSDVTEAVQQTCDALTESGACAVAWH